ELHAFRAGLEPGPHFALLTLLYLQGREEQRVVDLDLFTSRRVRVGGSRHLQVGDTGEDGAAFEAVLVEYPVRCGREGRDVLGPIRGRVFGAQDQPVDEGVMTCLDLMPLLPTTEGTQRILGIYCHADFQPGRVIDGDAIRGRADPTV